ncbi:NAD(P)-dependent oxidoreductase [Pedobacter sp. HMWF019]|uniref:SDR family oxidoreductase n=1 Tax=Pedobacter sp. HMWF019 TaxID=2056856 RepID=UPI000D341AC0|nr:SDR family oxidoreductase [Pedobacter sp. HMWF019]PTT02141.1 NAD(P)-dependent oxidoreductase [Pedobacter sp. HMWF019]
MQTSQINTISILGCGWYGLPLAKALLDHGYHVKGSTTSQDKITLLAESGIKPYLLNLDPGNSIDPSDFFESDVLIVCIPPKRNSDHLLSYASKISKVANLAIQYKIAQILYISSTSVYHEENQVVDENTIPRPQTLSAQQILQAEQLLKDTTLFETTIIRFGGLIGPGRLPGRFFAGKKNIPNGRAPINLIHLTDCIGLTLHIIQHSVFGHLYNACCPDHLEKQLFYEAATRTLNLEAPEFIDELREWKIISSIQVPNFLEYSYKVSDWMKWLRDNPN